MRVVSGAFERGMDVTLQRTSKTKITRSTSFMADDKETVNHAVAGTSLVYMIQVIIKLEILWLVASKI